jgi:hypothetical protein
MLTPPKNWRGLETLSTYVQTNDFNVRTSETLQPNITIDSFTFVNDAAQKIITYRKGGVGLLTIGIFEGLPFRIEVSDGTTSSVLFDGYLDFKNDFVEVSPVEVRCKIKQSDNLNSFDDRVRVNSFEYLASIGVFKQSDYINIPYIVERLDNGAELGVLKLTLVTMIIQAAQLVKEIQKDIATITAIASTVTGIAGSLLLAIVTLILDVIFLIVLVTQMLSLLITMIELIAPPVRFQKGAYFKNLLQTAFAWLGYGFNTTISELDNLVYCPRIKDRTPITATGVPKIGEAGETVSDLIGIVLRTTNSRIAIIDNVVHMHTDASSEWIKNSTYVSPDVGNSDSSAMNLESEEKVFNVNDFNSSTVIGFNTDGADQWTLDDDAGTDAQAIRFPLIVKNDKMVLFNGLEKVDIPMALGSRKTDLSSAETILEAIQQALSPILIQVNKILGNQVGANLSNVGGSLPPKYSTVLNYLNTTSRVGALRISSKTTNVAKMLYMEKIGLEYKIPVNHRTLFSAGAMYSKYYISNSFANTNQFKGQRLLFTERTIPFAYSDFLKINKNSYFATADGKIGKMESVKWALDSDKATVDYWIEEVYSENISEKLIVND